MAIPLAFWMLARVFSLPMAVVGMAAFRDGNKPRGEAEAVPGNPVGEIVFPVVLRKPETPEAAPKQIAKPSPRLVVSNPPREPRSQAERLEAVDAITRRWIAEATSKATISMGMSGKDAYAAYSRWCEEFRVAPASASHFGRSVKRIGIVTGRTVEGAKYGLKLKGGNAAKIA